MSETERLPSKNRIRRQITKKLEKTLFSLSTQELQFLLEEPYIQTTEILEFMELTLFPLTTGFRNRCQMWEHKMEGGAGRYPTLKKLVVYRHIYENWDGQEPFVGRDVKKIKYYLD